MNQVYNPHMDKYIDKYIMIIVFEAKINKLLSKSLST